MLHSKCIKKTRLCLSGTKQNNDWETKTRHCSSKCAAQGKMKRKMKVIKRQVDITTDLSPFSIPSTSNTMSSNECRFTPTHGNCRHSLQWQFSAVDSCRLGRTIHYQCTVVKWMTDDESKTLYKKFKQRNKVIDIWHLIIVLRQNIIMQTKLKFRQEPSL